MTPPDPPTRSADDLIFDAYLAEALGANHRPDLRERILECATSRGLLGSYAVGRSGPQPSHDTGSPAPRRSMKPDRSSHSPFVLATAAVLLLGALLVAIIAGPGTANAPDDRGNGVAAQPGDNTNRPVPEPPDNHPVPGDRPDSRPRYESFDIQASPEVAAISSQVVDGTNAMGIDLLTALRAKDGNANTMISPLSIAMLLHMTLNGATGDTAAEMRTALHLPGISLDKVNVTNQMQKAVAEKLRTQSTVRISNSLWADPAMALEHRFADTLHDYYGALIAPLRDAATINDWVKQQTAGLIPEVVNDDVVKNSRLILVNALYFKGTWKKQFDPARTGDQDFRLPAGDHVKVPTMSLGPDYFATRFTDVYNAFYMPFTDRQLGVTVLVPTDDHSPADVLKAIQAEGWRQLCAKFEFEEIYLSLPRMKISWNGSLADVLRTAGMKRAFVPGQAEFPGIASDRELAVTRITHSTMMAVDEKGAEGAAATMDGMLDSPTPFIHADRPFVMVTSDRETGAMLMIAVVNDPR